MADINNTTNEAIEKELADKREALRVFRFGTAGSRSRNVKEAATLKKGIARLLTEVVRRSHNA